MGLKVKGENGVKALLKSQYPGAFRRFPTVGDAAAAVAATAAAKAQTVLQPAVDPPAARDTIVATVDGNVLLMQIPGEVETFAEYVNVVVNILHSHLRSASVVVVVFDEPEILTKAKREEQNRRDESRTKPATYHSGDLAPVPVDDNYSQADIERVRNCHEVMASRAARSRLYDAIGVEVLRRFANIIDGTLVFDGLDPRGATRPMGAVRAPTMSSAGARTEGLVDALAHGPIGEGDLKLAAIEEAVRGVAARPEAERPAALRSACVHFAVTIDTDSLAIGLLQRARRDVAVTGATAPAPMFKTAMLMRERAPKRDRWGDEGRASYLVCDYDALYVLVQKDMWEANARSVRAMDPVLKRRAITLLVSGWILAGSDFAEIKSLHARMVTEAVPALLRHSERMVAAATDVVSAGQAAGVRLLVPQLLERLVELCARTYADEKGARKATIANLAHYDEVQLRRAAWCIAYWSGHEFRHDLDEFGFVVDHGDTTEEDDN